MSEADYKKVSDAAEFGRVAVLMGGDSAEREISLLTGQAVHGALLDRGVDAHQVDATGDFIEVLTEGSFDRVWIALHGRGGEDGTMQGLLQTLNIPYTGSGVLGSALAMDKLRTKELLEGIGIATPPWRLISDEAECPAVAAELGVPMIVKPALEGSSIGMSRVEAAADLPAAYRKAAESPVPRCLPRPGCMEARIHGGGTSTIRCCLLIRIDANNNLLRLRSQVFQRRDPLRLPLRPVGRAGG